MLLIRKIKLKNYVLIILIIIGLAGCTKPTPAIIEGVKAVDKGLSIVLQGVAPASTLTPAEVASLNSRIIELKETSRLLVKRVSQD